MTTYFSTFLIDKKTSIDFFRQFRNLLFQKFSIIILYEADLHTFFFFDFLFETFR